MGLNVVEKAEFLIWIFSWNKLDIYILYFQQYELIKLCQVLEIFRQILIIMVPLAFNLVLCNPYKKYTQIKLHPIFLNVDESYLQ